MHYIYKSKSKTLKFSKLKKFKNLKQISIISPSYNEEENISRFIDQVSKAVKGYNYEIIIVDDNSTDKTPEIIDKYTKSNIVALHRYGKRGIFSAILDGIKVSRSPIVIIMDSDFSHPPKKIPELLKYMDKYDIVSGSRFVKSAGIEAPFARTYATILLNFVLRIILGLKPKDLTGGFHAIRKEKLKHLKFKYKTIWGEFDMELFYRAIKKGFKVKEVPFTYKFREEGVSKSENLLKYAYVYLKRALELRFRN